MAVANLKTTTLIPTPVLPDLNMSFKDNGQVFNWGGFNYPPLFILHYME